MWLFLLAETWLFTSQHNTTAYLEQISNLWSFVLTFLQFRLLKNPKWWVWFYNEASQNCSDETQQRPFMSSLLLNPFFHRKCHGFEVGVSSGKRWWDSYLTFLWWLLFTLRAVAMERTDWHSDWGVIFTKSVNFRGIPRAGLCNRSFYRLIFFEQKLEQVSHILYSIIWYITAVSTHTQSGFGLKYLI